jgi:16S rRNA (guanine(966)-N(2))-methyltransferase RsmD
MMRVITGHAKGRKLLSVPGPSTRPISDRVKTALFDTLGLAVVDCHFLDLFAGTGSVGIEALSRGAARAVFVEINRLALRTIGENLRRTALAGNAHVERGDAFAFLRRPAPVPFDIIYVAPPQYRGLWIKTLQTIDSHPALLAEGGRVIVQIHPREREALDLHHLELIDERTYGSTLLQYWGRSTVQSTLTGGDASQPFPATT